MREASQLGEPKQGAAETQPPKLTRAHDLLNHIIFLLHLHLRTLTTTSITGDRQIVPVQAIPVRRAVESVTGGSWGAYVLMGRLGVSGA